MAALDSDLTLAATLATELGGGVTAADARLPRIISAASDACRQYLLRPQVHYQVGRSEKARGRGRQRLVLELTPILSVASVTLVDGTVVDATDYLIESAEAGLVYRRAGWPFTGVVRPGLLYADALPGSEEPNITVVYTGGWVTPVQAASGGSPPARTLPFDLEEACIQACVALYRRPMDPNVATEALGDYSVSFRSPNLVTGLGAAPVPDAAARILDAYRRPLG